VNYGEIPYTDNVRYPTTPTSSLGFDKVSISVRSDITNISIILLTNQVYLINLMRQSERRKRMLSALNELGLEYTVVNAVDGR
jgi:hypothetical protein